MRKYDLSINGRNYRVHVQKFNSEEATLRVKGKTYTIKVKDIVDTGSKVRKKSKSESSGFLGRSTSSSSKSSTPAASVSPGTKKITAPIPGEILEIFVKEGDTVTADKIVLKMEAMKMENTIKANVSGTIKTILINVGDAVGEGQEMMLVE